MKIKDKINLDLVVIIPLGPNDDATDTIESVICYTTKLRRIIVIDDSNDLHMTQKIKKLGKDITVIKAGPYPGAMGGLWVKLSQGYRYAYENFNFKLILRIDCDALVIGSGSEQEAEQYFGINPDTAIIGSYKVDCNNQERSFDWAARTLKRETSILGLLHKSTRKTLNRLVRLAKMNGYAYGESCLGGAIFQSSKSTKTMNDSGFLDMPELVHSKLGEDHIFGLIIFAMGYKLGDFATLHYPMGLSHKGLPDSPKNLLRRKKKIIHSIKSWGDYSEQETRDFFKAKRRKDRLKI